MTHLVMVEDSAGDLVDLHYYCSDACAKTDPLYAGWYGCHELEACENCKSCEYHLVGYGAGKIHACPTCYPDSDGWAPPSTFEYIFSVDARSATRTIRLTRNTKEDGLRELVEKFGVTVAVYSAEEVDPASQPMPWEEARIIRQRLTGLDV